MPSLLRARLPFVLLSGLALAGLLVLHGSAGAADKKTDKEKGETQRHPIKTGDGVELQGTFYKPLGTKKDLVVLLLHDFDPVKGGSSHQEGVVELAKALQEQGYAVLTFDFRGFGESKNVTQKFWNLPANAGALRRRPSKPPETIDHKEFTPDYFYSLVNDIGAAKASLDRKNDAREVNSSNVVVIGVGQGATLGSLWMASEFHRKKALGLNLLGQPTMLDDDSEGKDLAGAIWISISPTLNKRAVPLKKWYEEVAKDNKVPVAFVYAEKDANSANLSSAYIKLLGTRKTKLHGSYKVDGLNLVGTSLLLAKNKQVPKWVADKYLGLLLESRGNREWKRRNAADFAFFWEMGKGGPYLPAKAANEEAPGAFPLKAFLNGR